MKQASVLSGLKYALYIMVHPFDGFYDMRHEKRGNLWSTLIIYIAFIQSVLMMQQYGGFLMYDYDPRSYNVLRSIMTMVLPIMLFCTANWSFTALTDGEGRFVDILMALGYALLPLAITNYLGTLLSNAVIENEIDFVNMVYDIGVVWSGFLIFIGFLTIHQFTVKKPCLLWSSLALAWCSSFFWLCSSAASLTS